MSAYFGERGILMFERRRSAGKIVQLPVEDIHPSPYQARTTFDEQELAGLAQSIRENGLLQPITVRKTDSGSATSPTSAPPRLACSKICSGQT